MSRSRLPTKICLSLASLTLALLAAEGGTRAWLRSQDRPWDGERVATQLEDLRQQVLGSRSEEARGPQGRTPEGDIAWAIDPYVGFDMPRTAGQLAQDLAAERREDAFEVLVLGGSVAANFGGRGRAMLLEALGRDPRLAGRPLEVWNYARPAHKQPQQLNRANYLFAQGLVPDAVVCLDGFNELAVASVNVSRGAPPGLPALGQWLPLLTERAGDSRSLELTAEVLVARDQLLGEIEGSLAWPGSASALWSRYRLGRVTRARSAYAAALDRLVQQRSAENFENQLRPGSEAEVRAALEDCVRVWRECSVSLAAACRARGVQYLHVLQPTLHDEGSKPLTQAERETGDAHWAWELAAREGYPRLREEGARLRTLGVDFLDASGVFREVRTPLYYDACHFRRPGHELLAEVVAEGLLRGLEQ